MAKVEGSAAVKGTSSPHSRYGGIPFRGPLHLRLLPAALNASSIPETSLQLDFTHPLTVDMQKTTGIQTWGQGCNLNRLPILPTYLCSASTSYDRSPRGLVVAKASPSETIGISRGSRGDDRVTITPPSTLRAEAKQDKVVICDKIIQIFLQKESSEWRKLIAFSKQWPSLHESLFQRLEERVSKAKEPKDRSALKKLNRKLKEVHQELEAHNRILKKIQESPESDWESLVALGRASFSTGFFQHVENLIRANHDDPTKADDLARTASRLLMIVEQWDKASSDESALKTAGEELNRLLEQSKTYADADKRIDELAQGGKLDPALMLMLAKAYAAAKDTDYTKEEVKDVMAHLYFKAKESFAAQQPASVRILKHLISIDSPQERLEAMGQAFSSGPQLSTDKQDFLTTTPQELELLADQILRAYENSSRNELQSSTNALMSPEVISRLRDLHQALRKQYF